MSSAEKPPHYQRKVDCVSGEDVELDAPLRPRIIDENELQKLWRSAHEADAEQGERAHRLEGGEEHECQAEAQNHAKKH